MQTIKKRTILFLFANVLSMSLFAQHVPITPYPNRIEIDSGSLELPKHIPIQDNLNSFTQELKVFSEQVKIYTDFKISRVKGKALLKVTKDDSIQPEAYDLEIFPDGIELKAGSSSGMFYGLQSLLQLLVDASNKDWRLPLCHLYDTPRYQWRGLMLDESRHFFGVKEVKKLLNMMAIHKLNKFHWHLTDSPGWRMEIRTYPLLTEIGSKGNESNPDAPAQFYTQKQIRDIVAYAAQRHIEVIPEIDMPGHASAAVRAYPEISGGGSERHPNFTFHPGKEETFEFLTNVLKEVAELFPSKMIHIGGDEVHFGNHMWKTFPEVKAMMKKNNWKTLVDVEHYFLHRMADTLRAMNKTVLGWDEMIGAELNNKNTVVMWWRHDRSKLFKSALEQNYPVVMCPRLPLYFDFVQHDSHTDGRRWDGFAPVESVYAFPNEEMTGGTFFDCSNVLGMQANIWTEQIHNNERMEFMTFPRIAALAEASWTNAKQKDWANFAIRLPQLLQFYQKQDIEVFNPLEPQATPEIKGPIKN